MLSKFSVRILFFIFLVSIFSSVCFANINSDVINLPVRDKPCVTYSMTFNDHLNDQYILCADFNP